MKNNLLIDSIQPFNNTFILRLALIVILLFHGLPGMFDGGISDFGNNYLSAKGFGALGIYVAWAIKISHVLAAICLLFNKYVKLASIVTIFILVMGIIMVHGQNGWFVVGEGRNGIEFNVLLIAAFIVCMFPNGLKKATTNDLQNP